MQTVRFSPKITELIQPFLRNQSDPAIQQTFIKFSQQLDNIILPQMMTSKYLIRHGSRRSKIRYSIGFDITHADIVLYKTDYYVVVGSENNDVKIRCLADPKCIKIKPSDRLTFVQQDPIYISVTWATAICLYIDANLNAETISQMYHKQMSVIYPLLLDVGQCKYDSATLFRLNELKLFIAESVAEQEIEKNIHLMKAIV